MHKFEKMQHLTAFHLDQPTRIGFLYYGLWLLLFFFLTYIFTHRIQGQLYYL